MSTERTSSEALRAMARRVVAARQETRGVVTVHADAFAHLTAALDRAEHARCRAWLRTRFGRWFAHHAYALGLVAALRYTYSANCSGCVKLYWRGRRPYILGKKREWWWCLLRARHLYAPLPDTWLCAKCAPCPTCQSTDPLHKEWACGSAEVTS